MERTKPGTEVAFNGIRVVMPDPETGEDVVIGKVTSWKPSANREVQAVFQLSDQRAIDLLVPPPKTYSMRCVVKDPG
jgi:hypothetical protein